MSELIDRLRMAAHDIANERLFGWGNTCTDAADELERKDRELAEARRALEEIIAVDKAAPGRTDAQIWADMLEIAACAIDPDRHQERKP